jgi:hypothetical protein
MVSLDVYFKKKLSVKSVFWVYFSIEFFSIVRSIEKNKKWVKNQIPLFYFLWEKKYRDNEKISCVDLLFKKKRKKRKEYFFFCGVLFREDSFRKL